MQKICYIAIFLGKYTCSYNYVLFFSKMFYHEIEIEIKFPAFVATVRGQTQPSKRKNSFSIHVIIFFFLHVLKCC